MDYATLSIENFEAVKVVSLNRPPVNALNGRVRDELTHLFEAANDCRRTRALVLTGAGHVFCAGADLKDRPDSSSEGAFWGHARKVRDCFDALKDCKKPVICAVNGPALGAGFVLAAYSDIIVPSEKAKFGMPEINVGLAGGAAMLNQLFHRSTLRKLFFTGDAIPAEELYRLGVCERPEPHEKLMEAALELAQKIASKSPTGMLYAKKSANLVELLPEREAYRVEQTYTFELSKLPDTHEAQRAFFEKREPQFGQDQ